MNINQTTSNSKQVCTKREKHESNCWESNPGQLAMATSVLPLSYNYHSNASIMFLLYTDYIY